MSHQLPNLPAGQSMFNCTTNDGKVFTTEDMRAYAELAIASVKRGPLHDQKIAGIIASKVSEEYLADELLCTELFMLSRAIEQAHGITKDK